MKYVGDNALRELITKIKTVVDDKSKVSVSDTGTATDTVNYITVDGTEKKIGGSSLPEVTTTDNGDVLQVVEGVWVKSEIDETELVDIEEVELIDIPNPLPSVTTADNGKILKVVNGIWDKAEGGGGLELQSIVITTPPTKTSYIVGENFDNTGMVVTANYGYGLSQIVTGYTISPSGALSSSDTFVTISYSESGVTKTTTQAITVGKITLPIPTLSGTYTYTGNSQIPTFNNYDSTKMSISGDSSAINAGNYTAIFSLLNTDAYVWSDSTITNKEVNWSISKATPSLTLSSNSVTLNSSTQSATVTVTTNSDGVKSVSSSDTTIATAGINDSTITINSVNQTSGNATITLTIAEGNNYLSTSGTITVSAQFVSIYGVQWDGSSSSVLSRTDNAVGFSDPVPYVSGASSYGSPFDTLMPWSGMVRVSTEKAGEVVAIPKFWYKLTQNGTYGVKIQIADSAVEGFSVSPAHMDRGDGAGERDFVYVGRYHCATSTYKSSSGVKPQASITRSTARTNIHNLGSDVWQFSFAERFTLWLLYIVEFANWNSQSCIGYGCGDNSSAGNMGYTDSMPYHTGTTQSSRTTYGLGTQYRYIEGLWDNVYDWCDGGYNSSAGLNLILNPNNYSDSSGGVSVGTPTSGWIGGLGVSSVSGAYPVFINNNATGDGSNYVADYWYFNASEPCLLVGGFYGQDLYYGLFVVYCSVASSASGLIGCRLTTFSTT